MPPLVSVVIPTRDRPGLLPEAVSSVLAQSLADWELIVVDDGSEVPARRALAPALRDRRVRLLRHERPRGLPAARNAGIEAAGGELIATLDDDDLWLPGYLERMAAAFGSFPQIGAAACGLQRVKLDDGKPLGVIFASRPGLKGLSDIVKEGLGVPSGVVFLRRAWREVGGFDERLPCFNDMDFFLRLAERFAACRVDGTWVIRRIHGSNMSKDGLAILETIAVWESFLARHPEFVRPVSAELAAAHYRAAKTLTLRADWAPALSHVRESLRLWPQVGGRSARGRGRAIRWAAAAEPWVLAAVLGAVQSPLGRLIEPLLRRWLRRRYIGLANSRGAP